MRTKGREFTWAFLLAPVSFLKNFKLVVDLSNRRSVERGGKLIPLELGSPSKAAVVAVGVVAPAPATGGVYFFSQWRPPSLHLHFPQVRHVQTAAQQGHQQTPSMKGRPRSF